MVHSLDPDAIAADLGAWRDRPGPRYVQLADSLANLIAVLSPPDDSRLPSERALAEALSVSRGTVISSYDELARRGVVTRKQGSGTRVRSSDSGSVLNATTVVDRNLLRSMTNERREAIDLSWGSPTMDEQVAKLQPALGAALAAGSGRHGYCPAGLPELRAAIAQRMSSQGTPTEADQILVTAGAQGALTLLSELMVRGSGHVIVESPTYAGAAGPLRRAGAQLIAVERDHAGPRPDDLRRVLQDRGISFAYLVPTCHNPTGTTMHEHRRMQLLAVCQEHRVPVVEDLTLADLQFEGERPPDMVSLAPKDVIAIGSFSKVLWGGLRIGWIRAPREEVLRLTRMRAAIDLGCSVLGQMAVLEAFPLLEEIAQRRREQMKRGHEILREELAAQLPEFDVQRSVGGCSLWVRIPEGNADALAAAALSHGVSVTSGAVIVPYGRYLDHLRLATSACEEDLREGIARLKAAWDELRSRSPHELELGIQPV